MHYPIAKSRGVLKQLMGATVPPHTRIGVGPPCRQNRKAARPGIEPGLHGPESDADPIEPNRCWTVICRIYLSAYRSLLRSVLTMEVHETLNPKP